jgi:isopentenyldiphosphate isomerase
MDKPKATIVNEDDKIIGYKNRGTLKQEDIYRVSALWIQNSKGDILLAQRSFNKNKGPGLWGPAAAGIVDEGETYDSNIIKEAEEEIGLKGYDFKKIEKRRVRNPYNYFRQLYFLKLDKEIDYFIKQDEEVEKIKWFTKKELLEEIKNNPEKFLKSVSECIELGKL